MTNIVQPSTTTSPAVPLTQAEQIKGKVVELQVALSNSIPGYESLLHVIHRALLADEELTHLMTEEEIGIICQGLQKKTGVVITTAAVKKNMTTGAGKKLSSVSLGDL